MCMFCSFTGCREGTRKGVGGEWKTCLSLDGTPSTSESNRRPAGGLCSGFHSTWGCLAICFKDFSPAAGRIVLPLELWGPDDPGSSVLSCHSEVVRIRYKEKQDCTEQQALSLNLPFSTASVTAHFQRESLKGLLNGKYNDWSLIAYCWDKNNTAICDEDDNMLGCALEIKHLTESLVS